MSEKEELSVVRPELLQIAEAVARDKSIEQHIVIEAMEQAIQSVAKKKYGQDLEVKASIDEKTGEIKINRVLHIVNEIEDSSNQISLEQGKEYDQNAKLGDTIFDPLPPIDFGRVAAQTAKQVIVQRVKEADKERQYNEYQEKQGQIINGVVKRVEYGNVFLDLGKAEAYMRKDETIARETFRAGDRVRAFITQVKKDLNGPQIFLSRTCNDFMAALFSQEVPEIYDGIIQIISVARDPGSRAKICVKAVDTSLDPVGACVGMRGSRVQSVSNEIAGERIDIILWDENPAQFVINAMSPATVLSIVMDEDTKSMDIAVEEEKLSQAIGRGGQNVKLASQLTGWDLNVMTEGQADEKSEAETIEISENFSRHLDIKSDIALVLAQEGFSSIDEIAYAPPKDMTEIEALDENIVEEIRSKARDYLLKQAINPESLNMDAEPSKALLEMEGMTNDLAFELACRGIITIDDLADQSIDELMPIKDMTEEIAGKLIMTARAPMFEGVK